MNCRTTARSHPLARAAFELYMSVRARPKGHAHPHFEPRDGRCFYPRRAAENVGNDNVGHPGVSGHRPQAPGADLFAQIRRHQAHDLRYGVSARTVRPVVGAVVRGISLRPGHWITVGEKFALVAAIDCSAMSTLRSTTSTGHNYGRWVNGGVLSTCKPSTLIPSHSALKAPAGVTPPVALKVVLAVLLAVIGVVL